MYPTPQLALYEPWIHHNRVLAIHGLYPDCYLYGVCRKGYGGLVGCRDHTPKTVPQVVTLFILVTIQ